MWNRWARSVVFAVIAVIALTGTLIFAWRNESRDRTLSPYAAQLNSPVRGLSAQEVEDLLNGRGAGYARTAEVNGYPGPRHVLDLEKELGLTPEVRERVQSIFDQMQMEAKRLGKEIVRNEAQFSEAFASGTVSPEDVQRYTADLGALHGQVRATHLRAHLDVTPLLSADQIARYNALRGYNDGFGQPSSDHPRQAH